MIFDEILEEIVQRSDGLLGAVIMGMDGIPIGELLAASSQGAELVDPDGAEVKLAPGAAPPLAERPGVHRLKRRLLGRTVTSFIAVNAPAAESDLRTPGEETSIT